MELHIQSLDSSLHDRAGFDCGVDELNNYLARQANQDIKRNAAGCWVLVDAEKVKDVLGYYTLSPEAIETIDLPELPKSIGRKIPRYQRIGAVLMGRLAVSKSAQGQGLGELLISDAYARCCAAEIPFVVMVVDPKDEKVAAWYAKYGFKHLSVGRMVVTLQELKFYFEE